VIPISNAPSSLSIDNAKGLSIMVKESSKRLPNEWLGVPIDKYDGVM